MATPRLSGVSAGRFAFDESLLWTPKAPPHEVLKHYRVLYTPGPSSAVTGAGDPSAGVGNSIGAISGPADAVDRFGR
jgi:hypothetical protein